MTHPLSMDIRDRAMARLDAGETVRKAAGALSIAPSGVVTWSQRKRATGRSAPGKIGGQVPHKIAGEHAARLRARMEEAANHHAEMQRLQPATKCRNRLHIRHAERGFDQRRQTDAGGKAARPFDLVDHRRNKTSRGHRPVPLRR